MKTSSPYLLAALALLIVSLQSQAQAPLATPLDHEAWETAEWLNVPDAPVAQAPINDGSRAADGACWFVTTLRNEQKIVSARWMTTGLGTYDLYINGQPVGDEVLKPGFTHPLKTKRAFTYDVTRCLQTKAGADNQLAAQVTPGWWGDKIVTPGGGPIWGDRVAFRGVLEVKYADGTTRRFGTNTKDWKAGVAGPIRHAAIFDGEVFDARIAPGYQTTEQLKAPGVSQEFKGEVLPNNGAEVYLRHDLTLSPIRVYVWQGTTDADDAAYGTVTILREYKPGQTIRLQAGETLVVDFGQNCAAVPSFVFQAKAGTELVCRLGELLNDGNGAKSRGMDGPEGSVHRLNLRIPDQGMWMSYTFADSKKPVSYHPTHTFFGYRFASITATDAVTLQSIQSIPVSSITAELETGSIVTGNPLVNQLISNTLWSQRSNYLSIPTDCPQRNERLGWTADTQVFAETGTFFANTRRFFHKWLQDLRDTQSALGGYPGTAPYAQYGCSDGDMMRVGWADAGIIVPWTVWKQFDDPTIIEESWESMERFMGHIAATHYDHTAHASENGNYQWADWLSYEPLESCSGQQYGPDGVKPEAIDYWNFLCASYWLSDAEMMRDMAVATGRDATRYNRMAAEARTYIEDRFLTPEGDFKTDLLNTMQTPALFLLRNKIVTGSAKERTINRLRQNFEAHGNCLQTGFLGTSILMQTLTDNGMSDIAYELLFQRRNPSWLYSIDNGATTIWERWNSYMKDTGMGPRGMNSFNHYAYGCVCEWLWETAAGIAADPAQPGFKHIIMRPQPDKRLGHLTAIYQSAAGTICSAWKYKGNRWTWTFTIPKGATASVTLPGETTSKEYTAGTYTIKK
ncbi:MAG: family 78 glycoside hydrolase catalytic domain [Bacteroidaceae bacterium]|nr:family 78 glycoside hydrolase catalytic domain [Bacteroidaceae bacterium]